MKSFKLFEYKRNQSRIYILKTAIQFHQAMCAQDSKDIIATKTQVRSPITIANI